MKRILIYLAFTFGVTYAIEFGIIYPLALGDPLNTSTNTVVIGLMALVMFIPSAGVLFTRLVTLVPSLARLSISFPASVKSGVGEGIFFLRYMKSCPSSLPFFLLE